MRSVERRRDGGPSAVPHLRIRTLLLTLLHLLRQILSRIIQQPPIPQEFLHLSLQLHNRLCLLCVGGCELRDLSFVRGVLDLDFDEGTAGRVEGGVWEGGCRGGVSEEQREEGGEVGRAW